MSIVISVPEHSQVLVRKYDGVPTCSGGSIGFPNNRHSPFKCIGEYGPGGLHWRCGICKQSWIQLGTISGIQPAEFSCYEQSPQLIAEVFSKVRLSQQLEFPISFTVNPQLINYPSAASTPPPPREEKLEIEFAEAASASQINSLPFQYTFGPGRAKPIPIEKSKRGPPLHPGSASSSATLRPRKQVIDLAGDRDGEYSFQFPPQWDHIDRRTFNKITLIDEQEAVANRAVRTSAWATREDERRDDERLMEIEAKLRAIADKELLEEAENAERPFSPPPSRSNSTRTTPTKAEKKPEMEEGEILA